jgi:hypothetical protein
MLKGNLFKFQKFHLQDYSNVNTLFTKHTRYVQDDLQDSINLFAVLFNTQQPASNSTI